MDIQEIPLTSEQLSTLRALAAKALHSATMHPSLLRSAIATIDALSEPLSAEELAHARQWFPRIGAESDHVWLLQRNRTLRIIEAMWATIDQLAARIVELEGALDERNGIIGDLRERIHRMAAGDLSAATGVLARKEATDAR